VLYECLSGRKAFSGETISDTLAAILKTDPEWTALPADTPESLRRLLRRSLAKDPRRRLASLADARLEIEDASQEAATPSPRPRVSFRWGPWIAGPLIVTLLAVAVVLLYPSRSSRESESAISYRLLTHRRGGIRSARVSPDGQTLIYSAAWEGRPLQLFLQRLDSPGAPPVALEPSHARLLSISSRGEIAILLPPEADAVMLPAFRSGILARIPLTGGTPRAVAENVRSADWDPSGEQLSVVRGLENGVQLEYPVGQGLLRVPGDISCVRISPSGEDIAFFNHPFAYNNRGTVAVVNREGQLQTLTPELESLTGLGWSRDGNRIWFSGADDAGKALFAVDLSGRLRVLRRSPGYLTLHDTTNDGRVLVSHYFFHLGIAARTRGAEAERDLSWTEVSFVTDISTDGGRILFERQDEMRYDVWLRGTNGSAATRLGPGTSFTLSPDGNWALAGQFSPDAPLRLLPTGAGSVREVEAARGALFADWTPDARNVVWAAADDLGRIHLYLQGIDGGESHTISKEAIQTGIDRPFHVSPDGRWVAALGAEGRLKLYPTGGGEPREVRGVLSGEEPAGWTRDGAGLFVSQTGTLPAQVVQVDLASGARRLRYELMPRDAAGIAGIYSLVITPDGEAYAYSYARYLDSLYLLSGLE
jgi:Tol biopolymer transport system component